MSTLSTRQSRGKAPVSRTLRFIAETATLTLTITAGRKVTETDYTVERIGSDFGDAYKLTKHVGHPGDQCETYKTELSDEGHICNCPAGRHGKPCKHGAALAKLRDLGRI